MPQAVIKETENDAGMTRNLRVLVVDDSALIRVVLTDLLQSDPGIEVVGTANDGAFALKKMEALDPDVITLDVEMPNKNGIETLKEIMAVRPTPVVMCSSLTTAGAEMTFRALEMGAVDFIPKPSHANRADLEEISRHLIRAVKGAAASLTHRRVLARRNVKPEGMARRLRLPTVTAVRPIQAAEESPVRSKGEDFDRLVVVGCSTGGPEALKIFLSGFPKDFSAPTLIVQHMPAGFTKAFADRLDQTMKIAVKEAKDGDPVVAGQVYIAPGGGRHMKVARSGLGPVIRLEGSEPVNGHRPSVDVLFDSVAKPYAGRTVAVVMTGMGRDGADGLKAIHDAGGATAVQNEDTCVVFGMPKEAVRSGGAQNVLPLDRLSGWIVNSVSKPKAAREEK